MITEQDKQKLTTILEHAAEGDKLWFNRNFISFGDKGEYYVLDYTKEGINEYNGLCRGMVVAKPKREVNLFGLLKSFPFKRFFNLGETELVAPINFSNADMLEKLDGSCACVFFPEGDHTRPQWHTRRMLSTSLIDLNMTLKGYKHGQEAKFLTIIGDYVKKIKFSPEDVENTFIFEFIHPISAVVTEYAEHQNGLYLIGARNLKTLVEKTEIELEQTADRLSVGRPHRFDSTHDKDEILQVMNRMSEKVPLFEGFVFRDRDTGNRAKLKSTDYVAVHNHIDKIGSTLAIVKSIQSGEIGEMVAYFPYLKTKIEEIELAHKNKVEETMNTVLRYHNKYATKKELAAVVMDKKNGLDFWTRSVIMKFFGQENLDLKREIDAYLMILRKVPETVGKYVEVIGLK